MKICLVEPFYTGSHARWAEEYAKNSRHEVRLLTLEGRHWKWRMHGGAVTLARRFLQEEHPFELLLAGDMLDLSVFLALTRKKTAALPVALYFHENQLTYPWSPADSDPALQRDAHYAFINYSSALAADLLLFNSNYHLESFHAALPEFLAGFPDHRETASPGLLRRKSRYLPLGLDLARLDSYRPAADRRSGSPPLILWNHRWEYDKNPQEFFAALFLLAEEGCDFEVAILGEAYPQLPAIFPEARQRLGSRVVHYGYAENFSDYARWLWRADILPVTSLHDFFGASVVQAIYCGCTPLLPKRLAYPEHLPSALHQQFLYQEATELVPRLRRLLLNPQPAPTVLRRHVAGYAWTELVRDYDDLFEELINGGKREE